MSNFQHTKFITGMRGYAALAVFFCHFGAFKDIFPLFSGVVEYGKYGVLAFFVISAFTLSMAIDNSNLFDYKKYMIRRICRIVPLYYTVVVSAYFLGGIPYYLNLFDVSPDLFNVMMHLTFLNLFDVRYQNSLIGGEWPVPVEFTYYLLLPVLFRFATKGRAALITLFVAGLLVTMVHPNIYHLLGLPLRGLEYRWSCEEYAITYALGIITYVLSKKMRKDDGKNSYQLLFLFILLAGAIYTNQSITPLSGGLWVSLLILALYKRDALGKFLFENSIIQYIGTISFSIYMIHPLILNHLSLDAFAAPVRFILYLFLVILISHTTYYLIEKPAINWGQKKSATHIKPLSKVFS